MNQFEALLDAWRCGTPAFQPFFVTREGKIFPKSVQISEGCGLLQITADYSGGARDDFHIVPGEGELVCRRLFRCGKEKSAVCELGVEFTGITFGGKPGDDYFYHLENPRIYEKMAIPVDCDRTGSCTKDTGFDEQAGNRWADPGVICERIGRSPYQPFPAILLSNYHTESGLVHGTLSQKIFFHNYLVSHEDGTIRLEIFSGFKGIDALECEPGRILVDEWYLGTTEHAGDLERIFERYTAELRRHLPPMYGATEINRDNMVWGSWNDGIFRDISEEMILREARFLKQNFPTVRWIQVDDGYAVRVPPAHGLGMPYEGEDGVDHRKFPEGLRAYTDKIRRIGLRPAVWIGGLCPKHTPVYREHPEWFLNYDYRTPSSAPLDVSLPEARDYMTHALDMFFRDYAFEGMKHDFWSYAFEDSRDQLKDKTVSGYEWRDWWLREIRKRIPADAYLQTGCDIVMANPFLGEFFTNYRYGIDIGSGNWDNVKTNFLWGAACFATHTGDLFVPNSDSVGLFPGLNDTEAMFCLNYCLVTHSMVEIAGKLSEADPESARFQCLKKAVCNPNNGQDVFLGGGYDYRDGKNLIPRILYFRTPHFSVLENNPLLPLRTVGLFNTDDAAREIRVSPETLGLSAGGYLLTDVWKNTTVPFRGEAVFEVEPHGSRLFAVSSAATGRILDANMRITGCSEAEIEFDYPGDAELFFTKAPSKLFFRGKDLPFRAENGNGSVKVTFRVPEKGAVTLQ